MHTVAAFTVRNGIFSHFQAGRQEAANHTQTPTEVVLCPGGEGNKMMNGNIQITFLLGPGFLLPWAVLVAGSTPDGREYGQLCVSRQPSKAERPGSYHSRGREFPPAPKTNGIGSMLPKWNVLKEI